MDGDDVQYMLLHAIGVKNKWPNFPAINSSSSHTSSRIRQICRSSWKLSGIYCNTVHLIGGADILEYCTWS